MIKPEVVKLVTSHIQYGAKLPLGIFSIIIWILDSPGCKRKKKWQHFCIILVAVIKDISDVYRMRNKIDGDQAQLSALLVDKVNRNYVKPKLYNKSLFICVVVADIKEMPASHAISYNTVFRLLPMKCSNCNYFFFGLPLV